MAIELTTESTHDDITAAVDQIIEARKGDDKGDAQKIAEEHDKPVGDTSAETDSGSEEPAAEGDDSGKIDWLDDDLKAELATYGIDEEGLSDFSSREEVERAMRFFDKRALDAGRKAMAEGEGETPARDEQGRFQKKDDSAQDRKEGSFEITLNSEIYDDGIINEFTRMRDHYESRLSSLEERIAEADAKADEQLFDSIVDTLGHGDLFGTSGKENAKQLQRRQDLHVAVKAQQIGLRVLGREVDLDKALVNRVAKMVFAEDIDKKELKARTKKISEQSDSRLGGGQTRPSEPAESLREWARREYKSRENAG